MGRLIFLERKLLKNVVLPEPVTVKKCIIDLYKPICENMFCQTVVNHFVYHCPNLVNKKLHLCTETCVMLKLIFLITTGKFRGSV